MRARTCGILVALVSTTVACGDDDSADTGASSSTTTTTGSPGGAGGGGGAGGAGATGSGGSGGGVVPTVCEDNCHYVRSDAAGDGSGSDWTNASTELPDALTRGHIYFVAAGTYAPYTFDDAESGAETIRVLRAVVDDHGTDVGWEASYADGTAEFGPIVFDAPNCELDGRGAVRIVGVMESTVVDIGASNVTLRGCDVDGNFKESGGQQTDGACTGVNVSGDGVVVANNHIHDAADDGVSISGSTGVSFRGNVVNALHGCGTDGGCGPCYNGHSDGLEIYDLKDSEFIGNLIYDVASTSTFFFGNWADDLGNGPSEYCENILIANNILYSPETGFVAYIEDANGVALYNNVLWGAHQGAYGGLAIGVDVTGLELYDNAILSINYTHLGGSYDPAEHHGDYNLFGISLGQWEDGANDVEAIDPGFTAIPDADGAAVKDPAPADFTPKAGSPLIDAGFAGDANVAIPKTDFFGKARDRTPNIGAIE